MNKLVGAVLALICAQSLFGFGNLYGKLGLTDMNPLIFVFYRELIATLIFLVFAWLKGMLVFELRHLKYYMVSGFFLFLNNILFSFGIKFVNSVIASAYTPTQTIWSLLFAILLGLEQYSHGKVCGIVLAISGALFITFYDNKIENIAGISAVQQFFGNVMLLISSVSIPGLVITQKYLFKLNVNYVTVVTFSYFMCFVYISVTSLVLTRYSAINDFLCENCSAHVFALSAADIGPILYWSVGGSFLAYLLMAYGNMYVSPSYTTCFSVFQPLSCLLFSIIIQMLNWHPEIFKAPNYTKLLGMIGIIAGIFILTYENLKNQNDDEKNTEMSKPVEQELVQTKY